MATLTDVGYVTPAGQDVFPTTAPHLDVRVLKDGKFVDPGSIRSLLTRLKVGKERKALWEQKGEEWKPSYAITSGYGERVAPTKGASTFHPAHDYGVPGGTPLAWEGPGTFTPGKGYGTIKTTDPQGTPYEIKLLHTKGGKPGGAASAQEQPATATGKDTYIIVPSQQGRSESKGDFLADYVSSMLSRTSKVGSGIDPIAILSQAMFQTPNYLT